MLGNKGKILYIGKAKNLRQRIQSYFTQEHDRQITRVLTSKIKDVEVILTPNEKEALLLECEQIKQFSPPYNIQFKDQKTYPYLCFTTQEIFPRLFKTRQRHEKGLYFGPFTDIRYMGELIDMIHKVYPLKKCSKQRFPKGYKPCLYYHIGECLDYCTGKVPQQTVQQMTQEVTALLRGKTDVLKERLTAQMLQASQQQHYEQAALLKKRLHLLDAYQPRPRILPHHKENVDLFHYSLSEAHLVIALVKVRGGVLIDKKVFDFDNNLFPSAVSNPTLTPEQHDKIILQNNPFKDMFSQFLLEYYKAHPFEAPRRILTPFPKGSFPALGSALDDLFSKRTDAFKGCQITRPVKGKYKQLLHLARLNAKTSFREALQKKEQERYPMMLKQILKLPRAPKHIEAFDIANTADQHRIGGMVTYENGRPKKQHYRTYNIKNTDQQNDVASIEEVIYRRYHRVLKTGDPLPHLILIDGGKGQLTAALGSLHRLGITHQPIISLAKKQETIHLPKQKDPLQLNLDNPALMFLVKIRDEVHRFIHHKHVQKRDKHSLRSTSPKKRNAFHKNTLK